MKRLMVLAALLCAAPLDEAGSWGQEGHSIVAEIAQRRLTPEALREVDRLLASDLNLPKHSHVSLSSIASWADDYRSDQGHIETYNWHFVDIPYDRDTYDPLRDCSKDPVKGDCVINALARLVPELTDCWKKDTERAMALKFIVHFIGDLHQPLHATTRVNPDTDKDDLGGNLIQVTFFGQVTNLHHVWDSDLILHKVYDWGEYVRRLETEWLPGKDIPALQGGDTVSWAQDAHHVAQIVAYGFSPDHALGQDYYNAAIPMVDQQLALGGLRLARVLNEAFQPDKVCPER
jgi:nuclease S1